MNAMPTPPIAQLEENGKPAILSYNIPDPTSYPGRNYIALQIDPSWFDPTASPGTVVDDGSATIARVQGADGVSVPHVVSEHGVIALSGRQQGVVATGALDAAAIEAAQEAGLRPRVYTVLDDVLTYRIERDPLVALQNSADETGSNDDSGQVDQTVPYVE